MKSRQELITRTLQRLKVLAAGQAPSAEDAAVVDAEIVPVLSDLSKRDIYPFGDPDEIEEDAFVHLATILANSLAGDFGRDADETVRLMSEARLRELYAETLSGQPLKVEYF